MIECVKNINQKCKLFAQRNIYLDKIFYQVESITLEYLL